MVNLTIPPPPDPEPSKLRLLPYFEQEISEFQSNVILIPFPTFSEIFNFLLRLWLLIFFNKFKPLLNIRTYCFSYFHQHLLLTLQSFTWEEHYLPFRSGPYLEFECNFRCSQMPLFWASGDNIGLKRAALVSKAAFAAVEHFEQAKDLKFDSNNHSI